MNTARSGLRRGEEEGEREGEDRDSLRRDEVLRARLRALSHDDTPPFTTTAAAAATATKSHPSTTSSQQGRKELDTRIFGISRPQDEGIGTNHSDASDFDVERRGPAVSTSYAKHRRERDAELARLGYTESDMMLASDATEAEESEVWGVRGSDGVGGSGGGVGGGTNQRGGTTVPLRTIGGSGGGWGMGRTGMPMTQFGRGAGMPPARLREVREEDVVLDETVYGQTGRTTNNRAVGGRWYGQAAETGRNLPQQQIRMVQPSVQGLTAESVDSSRLSQADLAPSTAEPEADVRLTYDPWRREVEENRRRGK
ncbi:MAG: hypothetical protein L6R40_008811 [Gallowayella cf. fulva]|nr:MAG: hypothetical protein L6R40_008811 [Xanthomendoza cf. fulva]